MHHVNMTAIIGERRDMPVLTEQEREDLRDRLARDQRTAEVLQLAIEERSAGVTRVA